MLQIASSEQVMSKIREQQDSLNSIAVECAELTFKLQQAQSKYNVVRTDLYKTIDSLRGAIQFEEANKAKESLRQEQKWKDSDRT